MSDGNFNRSLLPANSYRSGYRAGEVQTKQKIKNILSQVLKDFEGEVLTPTLKVEILVKMERELAKNAG